MPFRTSDEPRLARERRLGSLKLLNAHSNTWTGVDGRFGVVYLQNVRIGMDGETELFSRCLPSTNGARAAR